MSAGSLTRADLLLVRSTCATIHREWLSSKFASVEADDIKLYWVQLPLFDQPYSTLAESIHERTIEFDYETELTNPWYPLWMLEGAFSRDMLHILVELPAGELFSAWPGCDAHQLVRGAYKKLLGTKHGLSPA